MGGALKKIAPSRGRREIFGVFRVKNHDFTQKNHIFSNFRGARLDPPLYGIVYSSQRAVCDATEQCTGVGGVGFVVDGG